jgi:hypothetical protein
MHTTSVTMLDTFFSLSWARFGQGWRPDIPPYSIFDDADQDDTMTNTASKVNDDPLRVDIDEVSTIIYCCDKDKTALHMHIPCVCSIIACKQTVIQVCLYAAVVTHDIHK